MNASFKFPGRETESPRRLCITCLAIVNVSVHESTTIAMELRKKTRIYQQDIQEYDAFLQRGVDTKKESVERFEG